MKPLCTSFLATALLTLLLWQNTDAQANVVGQRRFLPLNQNALKNRVAIVAPAIPSASVDTSKDSDGFMKRSRNGFISIKRDVLTIRRDLATQQQNQASQRTRQFSNRSDNRFITRDARRSSREALRVADSHTDEKPREIKHTATSSEAILNLFGDPTIERNHPFLK